MGSKAVKCKTPPKLTMKPLKRFYFKASNDFSATWCRVVDEMNRTKSPVCFWSNRQEIVDEMDRTTVQRRCFLLTIREDLTRELRN